jgi:hypothetical protein
MFVGVLYLFNHVLEFTTLHGSSQLDKMHAKWIGPSRVPLPVVMLQALKGVLILLLIR